MTAFEPWPLDETDRMHLSLGLTQVVFPSGRLLELVELGAEHAALAIEEMKAQRRSPMDVERTLLFRRRAGRWVLRETWRHDCGEKHTPHNLPKGLGVVGLDGRMIVGFSELAGRVGVRIAATDYGRHRFAFDHVGVLEADGSVRVIGPAMDRQPQGGKQAS